MAVFRTSRDGGESHDLRVGELQWAGLAKEHLDARRPGAARHWALCREDGDASE